MGRRRLLDTERMSYEALWAVAGRELYRLEGELHHYSARSQAKTSARKLAECLHELWVRGDQHPLFPTDSYIRSGCAVYGEEGPGGA